MKKVLITLALLLMGIGSWAQSKGADEAAIKKVLETENLAAQNGDFEQWISCFAKSPDVAFGFSPAIPTYMIRSYDKLASFGKEYFAKRSAPAKSVAAFTDSQIRLNGNSAFVTCVQTNTGANGAKDRFHKADYLEKINGEWKMIGHFFSAEPKPESAVKH